MTDILELLRLQGKDFEESDKPYPEFISPNDAADEIERLREFEKLVGFIARDYIELSQDKATWQRNDWATKAKTLFYKDSK